MAKQSHTNKMLEQQMLQSQQQQNQVFQQLSQPTPEVQRFRDQSAAWDTFLNGHNYSTPPPGTTLGFDLWNPSHIAEQSQKMSNLEGVGAAALGGDNSIALQLSKERNANEAAQNAGAAYENAIKGTDQYFKGAAPTYSQMDTGRMEDLLGNATSRDMHLTDQWVATRPRSILPMILGGAISAAGSIFGGPIGGAIGSRIGGALFGGGQQQAPSPWSQSSGGITPWGME